MTSAYALEGNLGTFENMSGVEGVRYLEASRFGKRGYAQVGIYGERMIAYQTDASSKEFQDFENTLFYHVVSDLCISQHRNVEVEDDLKAISDLQKIAKVKISPAFTPSSELTSIETHNELFSAYTDDLFDIKNQMAYEDPYAERVSAALGEQPLINPLPTLTPPMPFPSLRHPLLIK
ncbi:MAG: hypothetical protein ACK5LX_04740 [Oscillospiraceae bacterium]